MTFQDFLTKWNGKYCEVAGSANAQNQCVDLANAYIRDVLGLPIIEWTNAIDFPSKAGSAYDYIKNTPSGVPKEGDLVIWGNSPGHIAIFIEGNANTFTSFDQNYPVGSPCHIQGHTYANVLGWMHPKTLPSIDQECMSRDQAEDYRRCKEGWNKVREKLNVEDSVTVVLAEIEKLISYEDAVIQKDKDLEVARNEANELRGKVDAEKETNTQLLKEASELAQKASDLENKYKQAVSNNEKALVEIDELKRKITTTDSGWTLILKGIQKLVGR